MVGWLSFVMDEGWFVIMGGSDGGGVDGGIYGLGAGGGVDHEGWRSGGKVPHNGLSLPAGLITGLD